MKALAAFGRVITPAASTSIEAPVRAVDARAPPGEEVQDRSGPLQGLAQAQ